ncbi:hypothetical protein HDV63DRAFT_378648 [Trichoderma sp. SZMC 28014]
MISHSEPQTTIWIPHKYRNGYWDTLRNYVVLCQDVGPLSILRFRHIELIKKLSLPHTLPCVPELETVEYLHELGNNWTIVRHDMGVPDNNMMCKMDSTVEDADDEI